MSRSDNTSSLQPVVMTAEVMHDMLLGFMHTEDSQFYMDDMLAMAMGFPEPIRLFARSGVPYRFTDYRMGVVLRGEIRTTINLEDTVVRAGDIACLCPGSIVQPDSVSDDLLFVGFCMFDADAVHLVYDRLPTVFNGEVLHFHLHPDAATASLIEQMLRTLWQMVHHDGCPPASRRAMAAAIMHEFAAAYEAHRTTEQRTQHHSREVLERFLHLVNKECVAHHAIGFYADSLCLTPRYLSSLVQQASGTTAKEWIDRALTARIKVQLKHTDNTISQIAYEMNFPNTAFFCKYFKRLTGMTPMDYRNGR